MAGLNVIIYFILSLIFSLVIYALWLRMALRYFKVSSLNPFHQLILTVTNSMVHPVNVLFKQQHKPGQRFEWATFLILILIELIKIASLCLVAYHALMPVGYLLVYVVADLIIQPCDLMFYAILIRVIMSYVNPNWQHPLNEILRLITQPLLILGRKIVPDISGFDFSPFIILIALKIITLFISASLPWRLL